MAASKAVKQVRDLHANVDGECAHCTRGRMYPVPWPCETVMATNGPGRSGKTVRYKTPGESLAARTVRDGDCLRWTGHVRPDGYGQMSVGTGVPEYVHRVAYRVAHGPIPTGMQVDHLCRVRDCVNPDHLEAVTQQENLSRRGFTFTRR